MLEVSMCLPEHVAYQGRCIHLATTIAALYHLMRVYKAHRMFLLRENL